MWYKGKWLTETNIAALLEAKDKEIAELTVENKALKEENREMRKLLGEIRSYYGEISPSWSDLFEEEAKALIEGGKP